MATLESMYSTRYRPHPTSKLPAWFRRDATNVPDELKNYSVVSDIDELKNINVAILCTPTRKVEEFAEKILARGIHTVDSFDIHTQIAGLRNRLDNILVKNTIP